VVARQEYGAKGSGAARQLPLVALRARALSSTVDFRLSGLSNDGDYSIAADAIARLISQGKLKFAVV
jgi:hypothetical protein